MKQSPTGFERWWGHCWEMHSEKTTTTKNFSLFLCSFSTCKETLPTHPTHPSQTHCLSSVVSKHNCKTPANPSIYWRSSWSCLSALLAKQRLGGNPGILLLLLPLITLNDSDTSDCLLLSTAPSSYFMGQATINPPMSEIKYRRAWKAVQGHFRHSEEQILCLNKSLIHFTSLLSSKWLCQPCEL